MKMITRMMSVIKPSSWLLSALKIIHKNDVNGPNTTDLCLQMDEETIYNSTQVKLLGITFW